MLENEKKFLNSLLGKDKKTAAFLCKEASLKPSLSREDKTVYVCTCDLNFNRVNLEYDDGLVTNAWIG